jgi:rhodanese-related sulfurtransferase
MISFVVACGVLATAVPGASTSAPGGYEEGYCGLYCMYAALHSLGRRPDFEEMTDDRYLSGRNGSTASDLIHLAEKYGTTAVFRPEMDIADLRGTKMPVVLHTSVAVATSGYHHWILFLGFDGDAVRIYDPPRSLYSLSQADLLSHWDGIGVVVGGRSGRAHATTPALEVSLAFLLVAAGGFALTRVCLSLARNRTIAIAAISIISAAIWHGTVRYGFLHNGYTLGAIASTYLSVALPVVTTDEFLELIGKEDVTIIDARDAGAYRELHVPGAINIPVTVTHGDLRQAMTAIPSNHHVVVYCASKRCGWADAIASQFPGHGYRRVSIYRGGLRAWNAAKAKSRQQTLTKSS